METSELNSHNKQEYPPMHTCEHILNQTMIRLYSCPRSRNSHIERKKSKCDYTISTSPSEKEIINIQRMVNEIITQNLPVTTNYQSRSRVENEIDLSKLPQETGDTFRIVRIGTYDTCACIGEHVNNTSEIGEFKIISSDWNEGILRIRFKLIN